MSWAGRSELSVANRVTEGSAHRGGLNGRCLFRISVYKSLHNLHSPDFAVYGALKGAIEVLTRYLAKELGERKIAVNVVAPGGIETDFGGGALRDIPEVNAFIASQTALGRSGVPDEIGPVIAALLSPSHRWINAQRIEVSGGCSKPQRDARPL